MNHPEAVTRTRLKICGITRLSDALRASDLGADALGFVFYKQSPRYIEPVKAAAIIRELPPFVSAVGLFVNPSQQEIDTTIACCPIDVIQLHGDETVAFCSAQARRVIKAIAISTADDLKRASAFQCSILLDAKAPAGVYGGTGNCFDWSLLQTYKHPYPLTLAGGLSSDNVANALTIRQWFALDVSSGVEASPGIKDFDKMQTFIAALRAC
ncbi:MAG: phosphoribosylanthranilate isomerase [Mariprofundus sp.]|nr:phosphoribosylanthranilate isomerase [Mariprofundus sp.]